MPLVSVAPHDRVRGWNGPGDDARQLLAVRELADAVRATYRTDAMMTMYAAEDGSPIHRVNRLAVQHYPKRLVVPVFLADWDTPGHEPWKSRQEGVDLLMRWREIPMLAGAGFFVSYRGARIIQPLASPLPLAYAEPYFRRWLDELRDQGIEWDRACRTPHRVWRLANVRRRDTDGVYFDYASPLILLDQMRPLELTPLSGAASAQSATVSMPATRLRPRATLPARQATDVGEPWVYRVPVIARACLDVVSDWHSLFMQLAGALLERGAPPSRLVVIVEAISAATQADTRPGDRRSSAETTLRLYCQGLPFAGLRALSRDFRRVALALEESLTIGDAAALERWRRALQAPPAQSAEQAAAQVSEILRNLRPGLTLVVAPPGVGKTLRALLYAEDRARTPYKNSDARGLRAPPHSKTTIFVDKHEIGRDLQAHAEARGISVRRLFGPLSLRQADGSPVCKYFDVARHVVAGGQPMQWVMCEGQGMRRCEHYDTCAAREGAEGPSSSRILIAPHALMKKAGPAQMVLIDEEAQPLVTEVIKASDLQATRASLSDFSWRHAAALRPALDAFEAWLLEESAVGTLRAPVEVATSYLHKVAPEDLRFARLQTSVTNDDLAAFARAVATDEDGGRCEVPPLRDHAVYGLRSNVEASRRLGRASRVLRTLMHALASEDRVLTKVEAEPGAERALVFTFPNDGLMRVLRQSEAAVVLDANGATRVPLYRKLLEYEPTVHILEASDGALVERTQIRASGANRTGWFPHGTLEVNDALVRAVRDAMNWAAEQPTTHRLGIITMKHVEVALRAARSPDERSIEQEAASLGLASTVLEHARLRLGPLLRAWPGELVFAHYGAVRGRNDLQHLDALITLGDPRPNLGEVATEAAFGDYDVTHLALANQLCANELEQAHGRLRTVRRTTPCRALHVGSVRPGGSAWQHGVMERNLTAGRPKQLGDMNRFELLEHITRLGGVRAAARRAECSHSLLTRCMKGTRSMSPAVAEKLRSAA